MNCIGLKSSDREIKEHVLDDIPVSEDGRFVTEEEYWENYYEHPNFNYEWNNGILEEVPVSDYLNITMYQWLLKILTHYIETHQVGKIVNLEFGFRLALPDKTTIRKPDLAVVLNENLITLDNDDRTFAGTYDLCVEQISDMTRKDIERDTVYKKEEYEKMGVKEYYILDARNKNMAFYFLNKQGLYEFIKPQEGDIIQSLVLKGFQFHLSDLFRQPSMEEIIEDELYQDFVFPAHRRVKDRAQAAEKEAEQEKQRADRAEETLARERKRFEEEKKKADRLAAKLRSLGMSID